MIVSTPGTCGGQPRIDGTRVTVETLIEYLKFGYSDIKILESFPWLLQEQLDAAREWFISQEYDRDA